MPSRNRGDLRGQNISQHAGLLLEAQQVAILRFEQRTGRNPANHPAWIWAMGQNLRPGAIPEQASTDQDARVVIEIKRGAADLHTYRKNIFAASRAEESFGCAQIRQSSPAALADQVRSEEHTSELQSRLHL